MNIAPSIVSTSTMMTASRDMKEVFPSILVQAVTGSFLTIWLISDRAVEICHIPVSSVTLCWLSHILSFSKPTRHGECWELTDYILYKLNNND